MVLPDESTDAGDFRDAGDARQFVLEVPVLDGPQLGEVVPIRLEGVHERPADAGCVGAKRGRDARGQLPGDVVEGLEDPPASPVEIGAVLEDDVHEGESEE